VISCCKYLFKPKKGQHLQYQGVTSLPLKSLGNISELFLKIISFAISAGYKELVENTRQFFQTLDLSGSIPHSQNFDPKFEKILMVFQRVIVTP
jgi:hypothetical protein